MLEQIVGPTLPPGTPEVRAIAVMSVDGQVSQHGTSQSLGSPLDAALLQELRAWADVVLVGANTVRAEDYSGVLLTAPQIEARIARGQEPEPPVAVISRGLGFAPDAKFFSNTHVPPLVLSPAPDTEAAETLNAAGAEVVPVPDEKYIAFLHNKGYQRIIIEGGPGIYGMALALGVVDVLHLTVDPQLLMTTDRSLLFPPADSAPIPLTLEHHAADETGCVFLRYRSQRSQITPVPARGFI